MGSHWRHISANTWSVLNDSFKWGVKGDYGSKLEGDTGSKLAGDSGSKPEGDSGSKHEGDTGSKLAGDSGSKPEGDSGSKLEGDTGNLRSKLEQWPSSADCFEWALIEHIDTSSTIIDSFHWGGKLDSSSLP